MVCDKANSKDTFQVKLIDGNMGDKVPAILGMQASCDMLGGFYYDGKGVRQSYKKAFQYRKKACDFGYGESCFWAGRAYYDGKGVQKDLKTALKFFTKSCELKDGVGCAMVGAFYYDGDEVVKQNFSTAKELYGKACDFGEQRGCDEYKKLKENGY